MKKFNRVSLVVTLILGLALSFTQPTSVLAATAPSLGTASTFSVLAAPSMTAANPTTISGDLGLSTGLLASKTGTWTHTGGSEYFGALSLAATARTDALAAFNNLAGQSTSGTWSLNASPVPGVWTTAVSATFPGPTLTLNGGFTDVWVFQIGTDFTFTGSVVMAGNAQPCNVFWQIGNDATIAAGSAFAGTLIAGNDITVVSGATVNGRILALDGALTTDANTITGPTCVTPAMAGGVGSAKINVVKTVINDNGGTKTVNDFPLYVGGSLVASGVTNNFPAYGNSVYAISETANAGYTQSFSGDCDSNGRVTINVGDSKFCIITNNDIGAPVAAPPIPPLIDVVKVPSPLALPAGPGLVNYTYTLRNIGTVPVTDVTMVGDTCSPIVLASGDTNGDKKLDVSETWVHTCSTTLTETHTNTVVATGWANGLTATDIASATVVVGLPIEPPLIHVTKVPSPLTLLAKGGTVTYTETITNPGTVALSSVSLTDDKCAPVAYAYGDINADSKLDTTETWTYTCQTNLTKTTTNTAIASGEANGITVRDFAIATVVVATDPPVVPALPNTGVSFVASELALPVVAVSIFLAAIFLYVVRKKQIS